MIPSCFGHVSKKLLPKPCIQNPSLQYLKLAPKCSVEKRAGGVPQLAPQEKQLSILAHELHETLLCINVSTKIEHLGT